MKKRTKKELLEEPCLFTTSRRSGGGAEFVCQHKSHRAIIALPGEEERIRASLIRAGKGKGLASR